MANSNNKKDSVSTFGVMHKILHHFSDWEIETIHMTRTERSIYFDMRTLYLKLGKPLTDDKELLTKRLRCVNDEELTALDFLLKDKFRHDKKTKTYRQSEWDLILKNYKFRHKANNGETVCEQNDETQNATAEQNSERLKAYRERKKKIISSLNSMGVKANSRMTAKELQALCEQHNIVLSDEMQNNDETVCEHDETVCEQKIEPINQAITNNHKPITNNHKPITINQEPNTHTPPNPQEQKSGVCEGQTAVEVLAKAEQIRQANAQDIQDWIAPSLNEMLDMLKLSGFNGGLTEQQYQVSTSDMKTHFTEQAISGKPIKTDSLRKQKLRDWIMRNANKPLAGKSKPTNESRFGTANDPLAVDKVWGQDVTPVSTMTFEELMAKTQAPTGTYHEIN